MTDQQITPINDQIRGALPPEFLHLFEEFLNQMPSDIYEEFITKDADHWVEYFVLWMAQMEALSLKKGELQ